jgi:hypothetical protein
MYDNAMSSSSKMYEESENGGGKVRQVNGDLVENMFKRIVFLVSNMNNEDVKITGKKEDSLRIFSKNGGYIDASVDVHALSKNVNFFSECKTYLDKCYLDRASSDLKHFRRDSKNICLIISLENAVSENSEKYFLDEGYIDKIFYLVDGKRSSSKPIWKKEYFKPINKEKVMELIDFIEYHIVKSKKDLV